MREFESIWLKKKFAKNKTQRSNPYRTKSLDNPPNNEGIEPVKLFAWSSLFMMSERKSAGKKEKTTNNWETDIFTVPSQWTPYQWLPQGSPVSQLVLECQYCPPVALYKATRAKRKVKKFKKRKFNKNSLYLQFLWVTAPLFPPNTSPTPTPPTPTSTCFHRREKKKREKRTWSTGQEERTKKKVLKDVKKHTDTKTSKRVLFSFMFFLSKSKEECFSFFSLFSLSPLCPLLFLSPTNKKVYTIRPLFSSHPLLLIRSGRRQWGMATWHPSLTPQTSTCRGFSMAIRLSPHPIALVFPRRFLSNFHLLIQSLCLL